MLNIKYQMPLLIQKFLSAQITPPPIVLMLSLGQQDRHIASPAPTIPKIELVTDQ